MSKTAIALILGIIVIGTIGTAIAFQKFDPAKFKATNGFDPLFLKDTLVKKTCLESHTDMQRVGLPDLGYCSKILGTL